MSLPAVSSVASRPRSLASPSAGPTRLRVSDLLHATEGRSVLLITHELQGLDQVDEIVVLDHGRVVEQGCHQQLRHAGGPYLRLWEGSDGS